MRIKLPFRKKKAEAAANVAPALATHDDITRLEDKLEDKLKEARRKAVLASLTPRQKIKLKRMIAQRRDNEKKSQG